MASLDPSIILAGENVGQQIESAQRPRMNALAMQAAQQEMQTARQGQKEANAAKLARMVLSSQNPAQAYPQALQAAQAMGMDVREMPQEWSPEVGEQLQMFASLLEMPADERTEFERLLGNLPPEEQMRAVRVRAGLEPGADAMLRGQDQGQPPSSVQEYEYAKAQGYPGSFQQWQQDKKGQGMTVFGPDGQPIVQMGGGKPLGEYQSKAQSLGSRMTDAMGRVNQTEAAVLEAGGASMLDVAADKFGPGGNFFKSDEYRGYQTAAREWIAGLLRLDSGAAVPDTEFERYFNTYFIAPGDDAQTVKLKQQARESSMRAVQSIMPHQPQETPQTGFDVQTLTDDQLKQMLGL